ncbi:MAG: IscS subfamily cysteine desulfurase [Legionellales bacterium]|nr:IscS subfamily cysteine desulfurase [Legionellales bacterium]
MGPYAYYFDAMASTPLAPDIQTRMAALLSDPQAIGNPAATTHQYGYHARTLIEHARQQVANCFNTTPDRWLWTSGATESINLALQGVTRQYRRQARQIITFETEHPATLNTCRYLNHQGFDLKILPVDHFGRIDLDQLDAALKTPTLLISVLHVNNETGVIQDLDTICKLAQRTQTLVHVDAAQTTGRIKLDLQKTPAHLCSISAHKAYGPKGIGALYLTDAFPLKLSPLMFGGGQERSIRSGTAAVHQIVGLGMACELAQQHISSDHLRMKAYAKTVLDTLQHHQSVTLNGHPTHKVPHVLNLTFEHFNSEQLMAYLPRYAFSSSSACQSGAHQPSPVLTAMGLTRKACNHTIRIAFNRYHTDDDIQTFIKALETL